MLNFMLDLETLGTRAGCKILSIGLAEFCSAKRGEDFHVVIEREGQQGLLEDSDTVAWWAKQSPEARAQLFDAPNKEPLYEALLSLNVFLTRRKTETKDKILLWGNGAEFDNAILLSAYASCGFGLSVSPWAHRCYRTLKNLAPERKLVREGTYHNALDDARSQARHAEKIVEKLWLVLT
jgi:hypothetical protein